MLGSEPPESRHPKWGTILLTSAGTRSLESGNEMFPIVKPIGLGSARSSHS
jgi:hypothetical protein